MYEKEKFIHDCINASNEGQSAVRVIVVEAFSDWTAIMTEPGEPEHAGIMKH